MDVIYFGSGAFGLPTLRVLAARHRLVAIVTQPDRPAGRGARLTPTPIAQWVDANLTGVPILKPENVNAAEVAGRLRGAHAAAPAFIVIAFGQKLGPELLEGRFAINLHGSLLPRWRGAAPINAAILAGDPETGNSVITLADRMDAGLILAQSRRALPPQLTAGELHDLLSEDGPELVLSVLEAFEQGSLTPRPQEESLATRAPKLSRADGWIDFHQHAGLCRRRIHGLTPWPGVSAQLRGQSLKITRVEVPEASAGAHADDLLPGTILDADTGLVACGQGTSLQILEIHPPGRRNMTWAEFVHGHRVAQGEVLESTGIADRNQHA
jgi:methionyl-tRNA formyltransferase